MAKERLVCHECGTENVMQDAWADPNTEQVISLQDNFYCNDCEGETSLVEASDYISGKDWSSVEAVYAMASQHIDGLEGIVRELLDVLKNLHVDPLDKQRIVRLVMDAGGECKQAREAIRKATE